MFGLTLLGKILDFILLAVQVPFSLAARCDFSRRFFDVHDYPTSRGGDGTPSHFHVYTCHRCRAKFQI